MIKRLKLEHIGPAPKLEVAEFGERLNLVTGDNGLGKTFLLDACWYGLTRTWADGNMFYPTSDTSKADPPYIDCTVFGQARNEDSRRVLFNFAYQTWTFPNSRHPMPGL